MHKIIFTGAIAVLFIAAAGVAYAAASNTLDFNNLSGEEAVVRVYKQTSNSRIAEVTVPNGRTRGTRIANGSYYIVVKYNSKSGETRFVKGDPFEINPPPGSVSRATIKIYGVAGGNYGVRGADAKDFEK